MPTFDRGIRRLKDRFHFKKQHRTGKAKNGGYRWTSSLTFMTFEVVMMMRKRGMITYEQLREFLVLLGINKKRGPAKLKATPAAQGITTGKEKDDAFLFPT